MNILIISAMEQEIENINENLNFTYVKSINFQKVYKLSGVNDIYLMNVGIGKVNAAISVTQILNEIKFDYVINIGTCGAIDETLEIGDLILADRLCYHDFDLTAFNREKGYVPGIENYNQKFFSNEKENRFLQIPLNQNDEVLETLKNFSTRSGMIITGDVFIDNNNSKDDFIKEFVNPLAVDMESAAIAQSVYAFDKQIKFFVLRSISDTADGNANTDFYDNLKKVTVKYVELIKVLENHEFE